MAHAIAFALLVIGLSLTGRLGAEEKKEEPPGQELSNFLNRSHWGVGLAVTHTDEQVIDDALVVNGIVRVTDGQHTQASIVLERHWFFSTAKDSAARTCTFTPFPKTLCTGLFVAAGVGSTDQILDFAGLGLIFGFGIPIDPSRQRQPHNIGLGLGVKFNTRVFGEGIQENAPPPAGETQIRYDKESNFAWVLFYSYTIPTQ